MPTPLPYVLVEGAVVGVLDVSEVVGEFLVGEEVFDDRLGVGLCVTSSCSCLLASAEEGFAERYGVSEAEDGLGVADSRGGVWFLSNCVREDVPLGSLLSFSTCLS